jgi:thiamine biosynthesis lipoprotein
MDTTVSFVVVSPDDASNSAEAVERAFGWFRKVEDCASRFEPGSEVMALTRQPGVAVPVSPMLFEMTRFALAVAHASGGAFDPTVGHALETRGFNRSYRTGRPIDSALEPTHRVRYRDVVLDAERSTITLLRPLVLDLGAVAKGFAIDLAARELAPFANYLIDAGGDVYVAGTNAEGEPWRVGIRHPREADSLIDVIQVAGQAVCTSGDYERPAPIGDQGPGHHIINPLTGASPVRVASVTVVAPTAMVADALGTAAFVLGPERGIRFLRGQGADGLIITDTLRRRATPGFARYRPC